MRFRHSSGLALLSALALQASAAEPPAPPPKRKTPPGLMRANPVVTAPQEPACQSFTIRQMRDQLPYGPGEALSYSVSVKGAQAGTVDIQLKDRADHEGRLAYPAHVVATSNPVLSLWTRMRAEAVTIVDPEFSVPMHMKTLTRSDQFTYEEDITFNRKDHKIDVKTVLNQKPWNANFSSEADMVDALSLLYYARSRDFTVGQPFCMELYQSRVLWRIKGVVRGVETVQTDAGPFEAFAATGTAVIVGRQGAQAQEKKFTAWMTADEDRIPVLLEAPTPLGDVVVKLTRFEQGRRLARPKRT